MEEESDEEYDEAISCDRHSHSYEDALEQDTALKQCNFHRHLLVYHRNDGAIFEILDAQIVRWLDGLGSFALRVGFCLREAFLALVLR